MRLATITNWAYGTTVLLTLASGVTMLLASSAHERERTAVAQRYELDKAANELGKDVFLLTDHSRQFVTTGDPTYRLLYDRDEKQLADIEARAVALAQAGAQPDEIRTLREAIRWAETLHDEQKAAIAAYERGDSATARRILFGAEHERELDRAEALVERFQLQVDSRTANQIKTATEIAQLWRGMSEVVLAITALLFIAVLYFVFKQRVLRPVVRLSDVVGRLAAQDYSVEPPAIGQIDEIGDMAKAIRIFRENGLERQRLESERDQDLAMRDALSRMIQRIQGCETQNCLLGIVQRFVPEIAPAFAGRLYLLDRGTGELVAARDWREPSGSSDRLVPAACWALRRGQPHRPGGDTVDVPCTHLTELPAMCDTWCLPLTAHGEVLGMLYFEPLRESGAPRTPEGYLLMLAENLGLALANLRLREALREMAMADALTGVANRRQLEARLPTLLATAAASATPLSCLMIDVDHFKRFNDLHGHDAGDAVLRAVGKVLADCTRGTGDAFRYGGEEFTLLLPLSVDRAAARAEDIRSRIAGLDIRHEGRALGSVTISIGLATTPTHVAPDRLVSTADAALLRAKELGRNRVELAGSSTSIAA
jgi:diguanylate cyclase (GGDEF)-like protein